MKSVSQSNERSRHRREREAMSYLLPRPLLSLLFVRQGLPQQLLVWVLHRG